MRKLIPFLFVLLAISLPAMATDLNQEYIQVRKIALKDPKVQEAFQKADERLNKKILEIDPSLEPLVDRQAQHWRATQVTHHATPAAHPVSNIHEHIIVKGDTLTSIAEHYHVTVAALKTANHITDERKLRVDQKLVIPSTARAESTPHRAAKADDSGGWWNDVKENL